MNSSRTERLLRFRTPACRFQFALCLNSLLLEHFSQRIASMPDMLSKQVTGGHDVALAAQIEDLVMLFVRPLHAVSQVQLEAGVAFPAVVDIANDGHETRLVGARI